MINDPHEINAPDPVTELSMAEYQILSASTDKCPGNLPYHIMALSAEAGEVSGKYSKIIRDHDG